MLQYKLIGTTVKDSAKRVNELCASRNDSTLELAMLATFACGHKIPAHKLVSGELSPACVCAKPVKQGVFADMVELDRATINQYIKAIDNLRDGELFDAVYSGDIAFSYDKINLYFSNKDVFDEAGKSAKQALSMSKAGMKKLVAKSTTPASDNASDSTATTTPTAPNVELKCGEILVFVGKQWYITDSNAIFGWLADNATLVVENNPATDTENK